LIETLSTERIADKPYLLRYESEDTTPDATFTTCIYNSDQPEKNYMIKAIPM